MEFALGTSWQTVFMITMLLAGSGWPKPENKIIIHLDEVGEDQAPGREILGNMQNQQVSFGGDLGRYSMFVTGRQKVFAHSSGLKDFYDLKHVAFFHFVRVILIFGF